MKKTRRQPLYFYVERNCFLLDHTKKNKTVFWFCTKFYTSSELNSMIPSFGVEFSRLLELHCSIILSAKSELSNQIRYLLALPRLKKFRTDHLIHFVHTTFKLRTSVLEKSSAISSDAPKCHEGTYRKMHYNSKNLLNTLTSKLFEILTHFWAWFFFFILLQSFRINNK